jgi:hypothetical protein
MSSWIQEIEYDTHEETAVMKLKDGTSYEYKSVSEDIVTEWNTAESQGEYFATHIRSNHDAVKR